MGEHVEQLQDEISRLLTRCAETEKRMASFYSSELLRAATDVGRFREALKEETRKNEKLYKSLEVEKAACQTAEADIQELKRILHAAGESSQTLSIGTQPQHEHPTTNTRLILAPTSNATAAPLRSLGAGVPGSQALAARTSFGAQGGLPRTSSGSAHPAQSPGLYGSPSSAAGSSRRLMALGAGSQSSATQAGMGPAVARQIPSVTALNGNDRLTLQNQSSSLPSPSLSIVRTEYNSFKKQHSGTIQVDDVSGEGAARSEEVA
jgi:hypothetical protein